MKPYEGPFAYSPEELAEDSTKLKEVADLIEEAVKRIRKARENKAMKDFKPVTMKESKPVTMKESKA
jgi:hypothetical protein